jgi:capsular polysaccharide biosynthesis protein
MRRILLSLARCYPRLWRERYGLELMYVIENSTPRWRDCVDLLKGALVMRLQAPGWSTVGAFAILGALLGACALMFIPKAYVSTAVVEAPSREAARRAVLEATSRRSLTGIINEQNLYAAERTQRPLEDVVHDMQKHIRLSSPTRGPIASQTGPVAMAVAFEHGDPRVAQRVTEVLTQRLTETWARTASPTSLRVIDPANLPGTPARPAIPNVIATGAIVGLIAGIVFVLIVKTKKGRRAALPPYAA